MKALRLLLTVLGLVALALAVVYPFRDVTTPDGRSCGTAWAHARHRLTSGGPHDGLTLDVTTACTQRQDTVLKRSGGVAAGGLVLLVLVAAWPAPRWRAPASPAAYP